MDPEENEGHARELWAQLEEQQGLLCSQDRSADDGEIARQLSPVFSISTPGAPTRRTSAISRLASGLESRLLSWSGGGGGGGGEQLLGELAQQQGPSRTACHALFASHALARWAWRTWEFAVVLILIRLHPDSLLLVSSYGLLDNLVRVVSGAAVGRYVDRAERLPGAMSMYLLQNVCILVSAAASGALLLLTRGSAAAPKDAIAPQVYWPLMAVTIVVGSSSSIGSMGAAAAVEREWVKVLCGADTLMLARMNSVMRAIDMLCLMLAPMAAGLLMTYAGMVPAVAVISLYSLAVWVPECMLLKVVHHLSPQLRLPRAASQAFKSQPQQQQQQQRSRIPFAALFTGWSTYMRQRTLLPALALALLYLTVLSLGFLMTAFLKFHGMTEAAISMFRGAGAVSGLLATIIFPRLHRSLGLNASGGVGIAWLNACLLTGALPIVAAKVLGAPLAGGGSDGGAGSSGGATGGGVLRSPLLLLLLCGLVASRMGIWLFDLAVSQMQQELVVNDEIGTVNGVQSSMQSLFEIMSFVAGSILNKPEQFHWLMLGSCGAISSSGLLYSAFVCRDCRGSRGPGWKQPYEQLQEAGGGSGGVEGGRAEDGGPDGGA